MRIATASDDHFWCSTSRWQRLEQTVGDPLGTAATDFVGGPALVVEPFCPPSLGVPFGEGPYQSLAKLVPMFWKAPGKTREDAH